MSEHFPSLMALALAQAWLYQVNSRSIIQKAWVLALFYLFIFCFVRGLQVFCGLLSVSFYEIPIFTLVLFLVFGRGMKGFVRFQKAHSGVPNFYFLSGLWIGLLWMGPFSHIALPAGLVSSLFTVFFLILLSGIKERLELLDVPSCMEGLPVLLFSAGILLLGGLFFKGF